VVMDLRDIMFRRMLALPLGYFHDNTTGNLISRFTYDVTQVTSAATNVVMVLVKDSVTMAGLLAYLLYLDWKLTMISLIMVPPIALAVRYFNVRLRNMSRATQQAMGDITQVLQETVECNKVVKIFGGQGYEARRFAETSNRLRGFSMKQTAAAAANVPIVQVLAALADFGQCGLRIQEWRMDVPELMPWRTDLAQAHLQMGNTKSGSAAKVKRAAR